MEKLISMTDFVLQQEKNLENILKEKLPTIKMAFSLDKIINYANFLKKPLKLGYFIPCDENDVPLEIPKGKKCCSGINNDCFCHGELIYNDDEVQRYQEAKQRVLFEGFEISYEDGAIFPFLGKYPIGFFSCENEWVWSDRFKTIEYLVEFNLKLTDTAKKEIGII